MRVVMCLVLLGVMTASGEMRAAADPADKPAADKPDKTKVAKQYVDAGLAAQDSGDYETAITMYTKAYQLVAHPLLIFNCAQAQRLAGRPEKAVPLYKRYLELDPHGAQAQTARDLVAEIEQHDADEKRKVEEARAAQVAEAARKVEEAHKAEEARKAEQARKAEEARHPHKVVAAADDVAPAGAPLVDASSPSSAHSAWKIALLSSTGVAVAGTLFTFYSAHQVNMAQVIYMPYPDAEVPERSVSDDDCGKSTLEIEFTKGVRIVNRGEFDSACSWRTRARIGYVIAGVGLLGTAVSLIGVLASRSSSDATASTRHAHHDLAIAPILTPTTSGATLQLTW